MSGREAQGDYRMYFSNTVHLFDAEISTDRLASQSRVLGDFDREREFLFRQTQMVAKGCRAVRQTWRALGRD